MQVIAEKGSAPIKAWVDGVEFEESAKAQLRNLAAMPFVKAISVMPDVHAGIGSTVGTVFATEDVLIPAAVGGDIGCGVNVVKTSLMARDLPDNLKELRFIMEAAVPFGRTNNGGPNDRGSWGDPPQAVLDAWVDLEPTYRKIVEGHGRVSHPRVVQQLSSLGGGNHFLEKCIDKDGCVWIMLHSGSRGVGNSIGSHFVELAKKDMQRYHINLSDANLAYIPEGSPNFKPYVEAMLWAQKYAKVNRELMMQAVITAVNRSKLVPKFTVDFSFDCFHNYSVQERHFHKNPWITRKGACQARKGTWVAIPTSMGTRSFICRGKGDIESLTSCSHGGGRRMSRTQAMNTFSVKDHEKATEGVECRKDREVIEETPGAYKDPDAIISAQNPLVEVVYELKQVICIKG
jgi:tRNA-splicing ligase RtcB